MFASRKENFRNCRTTPRRCRTAAALLLFSILLSGPLWEIGLNAASFQYQTLRSFGVSEAEGFEPRQRPMLGSDGRLYGATARGGNDGVGAIFRVNRDGTEYVVLHSFRTNNSDGLYPIAGLLEGSDGVLYGSTSSGGTIGWGTVFKLDRDGAGYSILHHFGSLPGDGGYPERRLVEGSDGAIYGTTLGGGPCAGALFRLNKDGTSYAVLHGFDCGSIDYAPRSSVTEASDGMLYGLTAGSDEDGSGEAVYRVRKDGGGYEVIHTFGNAFPTGELVELNDGALCGVTQYGGNSNWGTIFRLSKDGSSFDVLYSFPTPDDAANAFSKLSKRPRYCSCERQRDRERPVSVSTRGILSAGTLSGQFVGGALASENRLISEEYDASNLVYDANGLIDGSRYIYIPGEMRDVPLPPEPSCAGARGP
jgi:uncharacterized repeat protein (TIGR03803 family)